MNNMYDRIEKHGRDLIRIFGLDPDTDPVKLCKQLRRIEVKAHRLNEDYCNGLEIEFEHKTAKLIAKVKAVFNSNKFNNVFKYNSDPRGYALKISDKFVKDFNIEIYRDWGGYGIIAPDLS